MQMHHRARMTAFLIDRMMQEQLLRRRLAREVAAVVVKFGDAGRVEPPQAGIGRGQQPAVIQPRTDVARAAGGQTAVEDRLAEDGDVFAQCSFAHGSDSKALRKKSGPPKLPDFKANASGGSPK